jgi:calcineurin-like phosphoesterase family protein
MINLDTWIVSDLHFGHDNIIKYCNRPPHHDELMIENWRARIKDGDNVLCLGDWGFDPTHPNFSLLTGNIYTLWGNHDKDIMDAKDLPIRSISDDYFEYRLKNCNKRNPRVRNNYICQEIDGVNILLSHYPETRNLDFWDINIHGHIHNNGYADYIPMDRDYRNVSIEVMNYEPVRLRDILYGKMYEARVDAPINTHGL